MKQELKDEKIKVINLTKYLKGLPSTKEAYVLIILATIIIGIISYFILASTLDLKKAIIPGTVIGLIFLGLPTIVTALLTALMTKKTKSEIGFKESIYLATFGMAIIIIPYLIGIFLTRIKPLYLIDMLIFGYDLIFLTRVIAIILITPNGIIKSTPIAITQPLIGLLFIPTITAINMTYTLIPLPPINLITFTIKSLLSLAIMVGSTILLIKAVDAPMKKNFGMKSTTLARAFLAHLINNSLDIEQKMAPSTEKINALIGLIAFKTKNKIKAVLITLYLHPGPFAGIGGAKMTKELAKIDNELNTTTLIAHGTATHDLNPMRTEDLKKLREEIIKKIKQMKFKKEKACFATAKTSNAEMKAMCFGKNVFMNSSFYPKATEDIDLSIGKSIMNKMEKHFNTAIYADGHNCNKDGHFTVFSGDPRTDYLEEASSILTKNILKQKQEDFKIGTSIIKMKKYGEKEGMGKAGIRTILMQTKTNKYAYVIIDGNNIKGNLREKIIKALKKEGVKKAEVMTTDSHAVNSIQGVYNPVGEKTPEEEVIKAVIKGVKKAEENLEEAQVAFEKITVPGIRVLGMQRASELIATVNSIVSTMAIMAPFVITSGIILSLLSILLVQW